MRGRMDWWCRGHNSFPRWCAELQFGELFVRHDRASWETGTPARLCVSPLDFPAL
jgi:hypothetical protein